MRIFFSVLIFCDSVRVHSFTVCNRQPSDIDWLLSCVQCAERAGDGMYAWYACVYDEIDRMRFSGEKKKKQKIITLVKGTNVWSMGFSDEMKAYFLWPYQFVRTLDVRKTDSTAGQLAPSKALGIESISKHTSICRRWCWCGEQNRTKQTKQTKLEQKRRRKDIYRRNCIMDGSVSLSEYTKTNIYTRARADRWVLNADYVCARHTSKPNNSKINKWRSCVWLYACVRASERERGTETQWNDQTMNVCVIVVLSGRKNI